MSAFEYWMLQSGFYLVIASCGHCEGIRTCGVIGFVVCMILGGMGV